MSENNFFYSECNRKITFVLTLVFSDCGSLLILKASSTGVLLNALLLGGMLEYCNVIDKTGSLPRFGYPYIELCILFTYVPIYTSSTRLCEHLLGI